MKILHTADIHLGVKNLRLTKEKQALLRDESIYNIRNFFDVAKRDEYDVVLICGDLFHSKNVPAKLINAFFEGVKSFQNPVIYISGNHDENLIFPSVLPDNFVFLNKQNPIFNYYDFNFVCKYFDGQLDGNLNNVLLLHGNIENSRDNDFVDISKYVGKGYDYIALGHVHTYKTFAHEDVIAYPGCLFSYGFDECGQKGFLKVEIENQTVKKLSFVQLDSRKYLICECNISNMMNNKQIIEIIEKSLADSGATYQDLIRVRLKGAVSEDCEKSLPFLLTKFEDYFHFEIEDETTLKVDLE